MVVVITTPSTSKRRVLLRVFFFRLLSSISSLVRAGRRWGSIGTGFTSPLPSTLSRRITSPSSSFSLSLFRLLRLPVVLELQQFNENPLNVNGILLTIMIDKSNSAIGLTLSMKQTFQVTFCGLFYSYSGQINYYYYYDHYFMAMLVLKKKKNRYNS